MLVSIRSLALPTGSAGSAAGRMHHGTTAPASQSSSRTTATSDFLRGVLVSQSSSGDGSHPASGHAEVSSRPPPTAVEGIGKASGTQGSAASKGKQSGESALSIAAGSSAEQETPARKLRRKRPDFNRDGSKRKKPGPPVGKTIGRKAWNEGLFWADGDILPQGRKTGPKPGTQSGPRLTKGRGGRDQAASLAPIAGPSSSAGRGGAPVASLPKNSNPSAQ